MIKLQFTDYTTQEQFTFALVPVKKLVIQDIYQRTLSNTFTNKLLNSLDFGFVVPLLVVPVENGNYAVIDGQHRLAAFRKLHNVQADTALPAIILPRQYKNIPLMFNIEHGDSLKDKLEKVWSLYLDHVQQASSEKDLSRAVNFEFYLISLGFAYAEKGLKTPSLVESAVKKLDNEYLGERLEDGTWAALSMQEALSERRRHAARIVELENAILSIADKYHVTDYNAKKSILSTSINNLWGRKRKLDVSFDDGMDSIFSMLENTDWAFLEGFS